MEQFGRWRVEWIALRGDLAEEGHLDYMIRTLIGLGRPLHHVYRAASWSAANAFGLRDRGMIAPGRRADPAGRPLEAGPGGGTTAEDRASQSSVVGSGGRR